MKSERPASGAPLRTMMPTSFPIVMSVFSRARLQLGYALGVIATFWFLGRLPDVWIG
jgi:hypothetical protein